MLVLPERGFQPSKARTNNVRRDVLCDWIEGSITFADTSVSQIDAIDVLLENNIFSDQDLAAAELNEAWRELRQRAELMAAGSPFEVTGSVLSRTKEWQEVPAYSFCIVLSLLVWYGKWAKQFGSNYTDQGEIFERLTAESLESLGWTTYRTGWSPGNTSTIAEVVRAVAVHLGESQVPGALSRWGEENAKEEGLDLVCSDEFPDRRGGRPLYFFQCASGANWTRKLHTPDIGDFWTKVLQFTTSPRRGCAIPFALEERDFIKKSGRVNGMMLDRYRLLCNHFYGHQDWLSSGLASDIISWVLPRAAKLPTGS